MNYGFKLPEIDHDENFVFGGFSRLKGIPIKEDGNWTAYLPQKEPQSKNGVETQACTSYGTNNAIETLINFKFGIKANYSDRAVAIASDTDPYGGNDPQKVVETIRKSFGEIEEAQLPFSDDIKTPEQYYSPKPLPKDIRDGAGMWRAIWRLGHEYVFTSGDPLTKHRKLNDALKFGTVCVSVFAWNYDDTNKVYVKNPGDEDNHWVQLIRFDNNNPVIFDSYDGFVKTLAPNYNFQVAKVYYLDQDNEKFNLINGILDLYSQVVSLLSVWLTKVPPVPVKTDELQPVKIPRVEQFAKAIQVFEGYALGTRSYRNNNPGNLRFTAYTKSLGAASFDDKNFCVFPTYEAGFGALKQFITDAGNGLLPKYNGCDIYGFFSVYCPVADGNNPTKYAQYVAASCGVPPETKLKDLV